MIAQKKARRTLLRNGWVVGTLVAFITIIVFLAYYRDVYHPMDELLIVGVPVGVALGALAGLAAEGPTLSRKRRNTVALLVLAGFAVYIAILILYLGSRV